MGGDGEPMVGTANEPIAVCIDAIDVREPALSALATSHPPAVVVTVDGLAGRLVHPEAGAAVVDLPVLDALLDHPALASAPTSWAACLLVVVADEPRARLRAALRVGVAGLLKTDRLDSLPAVLLVARAGHVCVPGILRRPLSRPSLSSRERQTLALATTGLTNAEIGARLFVAPSTVKTHLSAAFHKLGVGSRNEAAALLHDPEEGLMDLVYGGAARDGTADPTPSRIGSSPWSR
jgi:DNA-binding NarL/FixJ family response regulator